MSRTGWNVPMSKMAKNTVNPIRDIMENMKLEPNPDKSLIALSIGDPTIFGNLKPCNEVVEAVVTSVRNSKHNGYAPSTGTPEARAAVARHCSCAGAELTAEDVVLTSGCSHALDLCISVLADPGQNILIPKPCFPLYQTLSKSIGVKTKFYKLLPEHNWEVDLEDLEAQIDNQTAAILVNNPSNPCGSVYNRRHLKDIVEVASRNFVPIIADEIYDYFVFPGYEFCPIASLSDDVPVLTCGGLTKRFLVPGWRMGWILIHERNGVFGKEVRKGLQSLCQKIMGPNTQVQGALPAILTKAPQSFFDDTIDAVQECAEIAYSTLSRIPGLKPIIPTGAMYMMVGVDMERFPGFKNDRQLVERLVSEQSVFCLPGACFNYPGYFRIVLTVPEPQLREACDRMEEFFQIHYAPPDLLTSGTEGDVILHTLVASPV